MYRAIRASWDETKAQLRAEEPGPIEIPPGMVAILGGRDFDAWLDEQRLRVERIRTTLAGMEAAGR